MQQLFKRDYLVLTVDHKSSEYVATRFLDGVVEHNQFAGEDTSNRKPGGVLCYG